MSTPHKSGDSSAVRVESRLDWRPTGDGPPDGWRRGTQWFLDDGTLDVLYTNAPRDTNPYDGAYEHVFVNYTGIRQERTVTEWADAEAVTSS